MPRSLLGRAVVTLAGWFLVAVSAVLLAASGLARAYGPHNVGVIGRYFELGHGDPTTALLLLTGGATLAVALPATIAWTSGSTGVWPLRWLRLAATVFTFSNALVDFAVQGFSALINLGLGLIVLAVVTHHLHYHPADHDTQRPPSTAPR